MSRHWR